MYHLVISLRYRYKDGHAHRVRCKKNTPLFFSNVENTFPCAHLSYRNIAAVQLPTRNSIFPIFWWAFPMEGFVFKAPM